jgi:hypothetical protein
LLKCCSKSLALTLCLVILLIQTVTFGVALPSLALYRMELNARRRFLAVRGYQLRFAGQGWDNVYRPPEAKAAIALAGAFSVWCALVTVAGVVA